MKLLEIKGQFADPMLSITVVIVFSDYAMRCIKSACAKDCYICSLTEYKYYIALLLVADNCCVYRGYDFE